MTLKLIILSLIWAGLLTAPPLQAENLYPINITFTQPVIHESPYHRPYVAIWLETPKRKGVTTLALWYGQKKEDDKWLKDLRQWWRKIGRKAHTQTIDGYTSATKLTGTYTIKWDGKNTDGSPLPAGDYLINIEAAREDGGRDYLRQKITLGTPGEVSLNKKGANDAKKEIGPVLIQWQ